MNSPPLMQRITQHESTRPALSDGRQLRIDYATLVNIVRQTAQWLSSHGFDGVAVAMDNSPAQVILDLAATEAGMWTVPIPPFFTPMQTRNALERSGCPAILTDQPAEAEPAVASYELAGRRVFLQKSGVTAQTQTQAGTDVVTFTSGSTGEPRGLCLSIAQTMQTANSVARHIDHLNIKRHLSILPLAVLLETVAGVYATLLSGAECIVPSLSDTGMNTSPLPDCSRIAHQLGEHQAHSCILVPELLRGIIHHYEQSASAPETLRFIAVGGSRVDPLLLNASRRLSLPVHEGYGLSEAGSVVSVNTPEHKRSGSAGIPLPHHSVTIADDGEILLAKASFLGYTGDAQAPQSPYPTGDIGRIDEDGYLWIEGRKKNQLITSMGRNISPEWLESALTADGMIGQSILYGDGERRLSALIVSQQSDHNVQNSIDQVNAKMPDYAQIDDWKRVQPFTVKNGLLTGNGKPRRNAIINQYLATGAA